jgi:solute carrier family 25 phosphate transporter 23/24/25/41
VKRTLLLLTVPQLGLIGVFPYSAIDMGTYETLKTTYCRSMDTDEPPIYAVLSFGALSGSIGAASVYRE